MKSLHLLYDNNVAYDFVKKTVSMGYANHEFYLLKKNAKIADQSVIFSINDIRSFFQLLNHSRNYEKIYIHMFGLRNAIFILLSQMISKKKIIWFLWGGDFYFMRAIRIKYLGDKIKYNFRQKLREYLIKKAMSKVNIIATLIRGDYKLATTFLGKKNIEHIDFSYYSLKQVESIMQVKQRKYLMAGHSGAPSGRHEFIFKELNKVKLPQEVKILSILSYGNKDYIKTVINSGKSILGEKFVAQTDFLNKHDYLALLSNVKAAIFANKSQGGFGNILMLLSLGVKVFIPIQNTIYTSLKEKGFYIFPLGVFKSDEKFMLSQAQIAHNQKLVHKITSDNIVNKYYTRILEV